jgi:hypothetical protein
MKYSSNTIRSVVVAAAMFVAVGGFFIAASPVAAFEGEGTGTITVNKVVVPSTDPGRFNLLINGEPAGTGTNVGNGGTTGAVTVVSGSYRVSESAFEGTNIQNYTSVISGDCNSDGTINVGVGQNAVCTITNTSTSAGGLNVLTVIQGGPAGEVASNFRTHVEQNGVDVSGSPQSGSATGVFYSLPAGLYSLSNVPNIGGYSQQFTGSCQQDGSVTISNGTTATCTITNTYNGTGGGGGGTSNPPTTTPTGTSSGNLEGSSIIVLPQSGSYLVGKPFIAGAALIPQNNQTCSVQGTVVLNNLTCQNIVMAPGLGVQTAPTCQNLTFAVTIPSCTTNNMILFAVGGTPIAAGAASVTLTNVTAQGPANALDMQIFGGNYTIVQTAAPVPTPNPTPTTPRHYVPTGGNPTPVPSGSMTETTTPETGAGAGLTNTTSGNAAGSAWGNFLSWLADNFWWIALLIIILLLLFWIFGRDEDDDKKKVQNQNSDQNQQAPPSNP